MNAAWVTASPLKNKKRADGLFQSKVHIGNGKFKYVYAKTNKELEKALSDTPKPGAENVVEPSFRYIVREGDSFWTISRKLYGTGSRYKEIAEANNLDVNSVLNVGDELIIK